MKRQVLLAGEQSANAVAAYRNCWGIPLGKRREKRLCVSHSQRIVIPAVVGQVRARDSVPTQHLHVSLLDHSLHTVALQEAHQSGEEVAVQEQFAVARETEEQRLEEAQETGDVFVRESGRVLDLLPNHTMSYATQRCEREGTVDHVHKRQRASEAETVEQIGGEEENAEESESLDDVGGLRDGLENDSVEGRESGNDAQKGGFEGVGNAHLLHHVSTMKGGYGAYMS